MKKKGLLLIVFFIISYYLFREDPNKIESNGKAVHEEKIYLRMAIAQPKSYPSVKAAEEIANKVNKETKGRINIQIYSASALGEEEEIVQQVEFGGVDLGYANLAYLTPYVEEIKDFIIKYQSKPRFDVEKKLLDDEGEILKLKARDEKINIISWFRAPINGIYGDSLVEDKLDLSEVRVPKTSINIQVVENLGGIAIPTSVSNVIEYYKSGYITQVYGNLLDYYEYNHDQISQTFLEIPWLYTPDVFIASNAAMEQLTLEDQQLVMDIVEEVARETDKHLLEIEEDIKDYIIEKNIDYWVMEKKEKFIE